MTSVDTFAPPLGAERAQEVCETVLRLSDADQTEVAVLARRGEHTRFAGDRIHQPQDLTEWSVWVRAVAGGGTGRAVTSDLDDLGPAVRRAVEAARGDRGPATDVNAAAPAATMTALLWDPAVEGFGIEERSELARRALRAASASGAEIAGVVSRAVTEMAVATSNGRRRHTAATEVGAGLTAAVDDGSSHWVDLDRRLGALDVAGATARVLGNARRMRGRQPLEPGTHDVVLGPVAVGGLLESVASFGFTGSSLAGGTGLVADRGGEQVTGPSITLADDAFHPRGLPIPIDCEGSDKRRVALLEAGRIGDVVTDLVTAGRLGRTSTGHAHIARESPPEPTPANIVLAAGDSTVAELIAGVENGVFVERFWYLRVVDPVRTTLTGVARDAVWRIENGRLTTPLTGGRWTESVLGVLSRVDGISSEVSAQAIPNIWNGAVTAPALRVRGFTFGPAAARP
ncbi:TldD/PmbA family protein [Jatrophihabitans sp. YIM 134969]